MAEYKDIIQMYKNIRTYAEERDQRKILNCLKNYPFDILSFDPFDPLKYKNIESMSRSRSFGECMLMNLVLDICGNITELMSSADILNMISSFHSFYSFNHLMNYLMVAEHLKVFLIMTAILLSLSEALQGWRISIFLFSKFKLCQRDFHKKSGCPLRATTIVQKNILICSRRTARK